MAIRVPTAKNWWSSSNAQGGEGVIPSLKKAPEQRDYDRERFVDRNLFELYDPLWEDLLEFFGVHPCGLFHAPFAVALIVKVAIVPTT